MLSFWGKRSAVRLRASAMVWRLTIGEMEVCAALVIKKTPNQIDNAGIELEI
jgi:hypothetical protein